MSIAARSVAEDTAFWILQDEIKAINERRRELNKLREQRGEPVRPQLSLGDNFERAGEPIDAVGLSLSGGGMRSASLCLCVLQALNHHTARRTVASLGGVRGGGHGACSWPPPMTKGGGVFVLGNHPPDPAAGKPLAQEISDTEAVGHLRNYSNY